MQIPDGVPMRGVANPHFSDLRVRTMAGIDFFPGLWACRTFPGVGGAVESEKNRPVVSGPPIRSDYVFLRMFGPMIKTGT